MIEIKARTEFEVPAAFCKVTVAPVMLTNSTVVGLVVI